MTFLSRSLPLLLAATAALGAAVATAPRQREHLSRGIVAIHQPDGRIAVSWRLLGTDPDGVAFNLYRKSEPLPGGRGVFGGVTGAEGRGGPPQGQPNVAAPPRSPEAASGATVSQGQNIARGQNRGSRSSRGFGGDPSAPRKLNDQPLSDATFWVDTTASLATEISYVVRAVVNGIEQEPSASFTLAASAPPLPYLSVPLQSPEGAQPGDASAGDLDGDGNYDLVVKFEQRPRDNSQGGPTGTTFLQGYKLDYTSADGFSSRLLWTINLGKNIREGAHYTQFQVYDLDGDGRAEIVCKTADGTVDGRGKVIGDPNANWVQPEGATAKVMATGRSGTGEKTERTENLAGHILSGPEYLTVFDGLTGAALTTTAHLPARVAGTTDLNAQALNDIWGDTRGNRSDRYLACTAYLDGVHPSVVMCRGYYTRSTLAAWDWREGRLTLRWFFDSDTFGPPDRTNPYRNQGAHSLSVADVDGDGKDEIIYGAMVIDDDGQPLYSTGREHGDALHVSDMDPDRPGLEVFMVHEKPSEYSGGDFRDARTGELIWKLPSTGDAGRGMAANIDPRYRGYQCWSAPSDGLYSCKGVKISDRKPRSCNFAVWWDGDFLRELLDQNRVTKWNWETGTETTLLVAQGQTSNNGTKATPTLSADLFGDWREEIIWRTTDGKELRIYTTTIPTKHRVTTLMHDSQYRLAVAWQNTAYNQPPHPSFYLDEAAPPLSSSTPTTRAAP